MSIEKSVKDALSGIPESDDFYVKVMHALEKGSIANGNLESSLEKIATYKSNLQIEAEVQTNG